jgi:DNA helicase II / ATP-dependent DNA helicase PcrA
VGAGKRGQSSKLAWTSNLNIAPTGDEHDDRVRLFYVALTRAKHKLTLASARTFQNKSSLPLRLLGDHETERQVHTPADELAEAYVLDWSASHHKAAVSNTALFKPYLERYRLSITHLQNFVDVTSGGPTSWLISNLLKFPGPAIPAAAYGSAVHATLSEAQKYLQANNTMKSVDELLIDFNTCLERMKLAKTDYNFYKERGEIGLREYFSQKYAAFKPLDKSEVNFYVDNIMIGDAQITGLADRLNLIDGNWQTGQVEIIDFKTGKALSSWKGKTDFEKIKLHRYKQQLLFYELMLKKSKRFRQLQITGARLEFVEPDQAERIVSLELEADENDMARLEKLIQGVWGKIQSVDLPDVSQYSADYSGILQFEEDIIKSTES